METVWVALIAIVGGGIAGSIVNMLATRLPADGDPPAIGPPIRPHTNRPEWFGLVPYLGARSGDGKLDWHKLATDVAAAGLTAVALARHELTFDGARASVFALILLLVMRIDWQHHLIFSIVIVTGIVIALIFQALDSTGTLISAGIAGAVAAVVFFLLFAAALLIYGRRALGFGDVLLAGLIGAMTTLGSVAVALLLGMFLAAVGGLMLIAIRVRSRNDFIPYGAYLCLGAMAVLVL